MDYKTLVLIVYSDLRGMSKVQKNDNNINHNVYFYLHIVVAKLHL